MGDDQLSDDELLAELGVDVAAPKRASRTPREERIIAGFEDIQRFFDEHGRAPQHGEGRDIFERLYAVRLDRIRGLAECRELVAPLDRQELLTTPAAINTPEGSALDDDGLLAALGVTAPAEDDITHLKHVKPRAEVRAAEEIANRTPCADFDQFKPLFIQVQRELDEGARRSRPFERKSEIEEGRFFIVGGQKAYVAKKGEMFLQAYGDYDSRLRVIFDNGTESEMLMRSLQRALTKDETGRRITDPSAGPLFDDHVDADDAEAGTIYVLRSKSDHPAIATNRDVIHKIGVTGGELAARIAGAKSDPTYLFADVEVVATYDLFNINRTKLEALLHTFFADARLDMELPDRFGKPFKPREWFLIPVFAINEAVERIRDGSITRYRYDVQGARLVAR
jgi:hypothetical protein